MTISCSICQYDLRTQWTGVGGRHVTGVARVLVAMDNRRLTVVAIGQGTFPLGTSVETLLLPSLSSGSMCSRRRGTRGVAVSSSSSKGRIMQWLWKRQRCNEQRFSRRGFGELAHVMRRDRGSDSAICRGRRIYIRKNVSGPDSSTFLRAKA